MRKDITLAAETRQARGKNEARRLRVAGKIPAVLYGAGGTNVAVAVNPKEINRILHSTTGHNTIFDVAVAGGETAPVMVVDWLHHPVRDTLLHVDLMRIDLTKRLHVKVPVHITGEPVGVKIQGGLLEVITREIEIGCLPDDIPEHFTTDVTELSIGGSVRASDIPLSGSMKLLSPPETVVVHVVAIRTSEEAVVSEDAAVAEVAKTEPEVLKKGKKEEAGAVAEKPKKK
ncbi:MAG: 50S ribosomal protein L25 [Acidobacteriia bacterium]|nr:50S ribosomal protein L25 [Terriglobia bacterium]